MNNDDRGEYLGDSVYVKIENGMVKLMTNNGYSDDPRNVIYLETPTYNALVSYIERLVGENQADLENDMSEIHNGLRPERGDQ